MSKVIGIDISKQTFDAAFLHNNEWVSLKFENKNQGFKQLLKHLATTDWVVMEASGSYYLPLAEYLNAHNIKVCVLNPLIIKRFSQTMLYRAKTDKKDAKTIAEYGSKYELKQWEPLSKNAKKIKQLYTRLELVNKQIGQSKRQIEAFLASGYLDPFLKKETLSNINQLEKHKLKIQKEIDELSEQEYGQTLQLLGSIPGIGRKTAILLALITNDFKNFENSKQLIAYVGFSPRVFQSGTSVKGKGHICKMGKSQIRKLLYLCSWSAKFHNATCVQMYERLRTMGKSERVIKIAIANKLLKQAFAIVKSGEIYKKNYS